MRAATLHTWTAPEAVVTRETAARAARFAGNALLFAAAPLIGLAYVLAAPFVGLAALAWFAVRALRERAA